MSSLFTVDNPTFRWYALCVGGLSLKMSLTAWHTVGVMLTSGLGNRAPEDVNKGLFNMNPKGAVQLQPYEPAERLRRVMAHDVENNVGFFAVGLCYVALDAGSPLPMQVYLGTKLLHHIVYAAGMSHEIRGNIWTITSFASIYMAVQVVLAAL
eukprot:m.183001 g.183001  ORF g.183001 m.183001 type:complete len:153 (+) comp15681_c0_seq1:101-559(+)